MTARNVVRQALTVCAALTLITLGGCSPMSQEPPELEFKLDEAFLRMDDAVAETIAGLPDFPGFQTRTTLKLECAVEGRESYEINYSFPEDTIGSELVTEEYFAVLKEYWPSIDYEIQDERKYPDGAWKALEAKRSDGVNVWYSNMLGQVVIHSQVSCVEPDGEPVCGPPLGGVTPENDSTKYCVLTEPEDTESESVDAVAPFEGERAAFLPFNQPGRDSNRAN